VKPPRESYVWRQPERFVEPANYRVEWKEIICEIWREFFTSSTRLGLWPTLRLSSLLLGITSRTRHHEGNERGDGIVPKAVLALVT
jgi:hypothetical protein